MGMYHRYREDSVGCTAGAPLVSIRSAIVLTLLALGSLRARLGSVLHRAARPPHRFDLQ
jgi:hypothetical protein